MEKVLTFLISSPDNETFTPDLYSKCRNFLNDANVVVLHEFNHFYNCIFKYATNDFTFRLLVHSGSADKGGIITSGDTICEEIKGKNEFENFDVCFITRKPDWFQTDEYFTLRNGKKYWNMKYFNRDAAINQFLSETVPVKKSDLITNTAKVRTINQSITIAKPKIFIGSSSREKALSIAKSIKNNLFNDKDANGNSKYTLHVWNESLFKAGKANIENLEHILNNHDYGIFVFNADDEIYNREINGKCLEIPRDNVIFEYGMFMGKYTRNKVFFVIPRPKGNLKILSDLLGITALEYDANDEELDASVGVACNKIRDELK